ncbi:MAG: hypothetical protein OEW29_01145 [Acidimicrobiia bacterium]|nr:hypothetical protein [Acidimicrobiia bacterium]
MALFAVTLTDQTTDVVEGADAYQLEGPLTTFFAFRSNRNVIDSWSVRLASYRTADIVAIRRSADDADAVGGHPAARSFPITAGGIEAPRLDAVLASA